MNIGLFTDTYFPQVSGVATSIKTLRDELTEQGHHVYIFTTTDPAAKHDEPENGIYRFPSVPFVSFTDRRIAVRGWVRALRLARKLQLDIVHNQTEFSLGMMGKMVAKEMNIPCLHTYHTMYQDYLHYIANGHIIKPHDVARLAHLYLKNMTGIIAPSERVLDTLQAYDVTAPIRIIPTGVNLRVYSKPDTPAQKHELRQKLGYEDNVPVLLSLSRLAYEKNIQALIEALPDILQHRPDAQLLIVGDGPARETLERQVVKTYDEALASNLPIVVMRSEYTDELIDDPAIGMSFQKRGDLVKGVLYYLDHPDTQETITKRQQKLHDISSEVFGQRVMDFYLECQKRLQDEQDEKKRQHHLFGKRG